MADQSGAVNAKVPWGAAGAAGGSLVGSAVADLLTSGLKALGLVLSERNEGSIDILVVAAVAYGGSYLVGYFKDSGLTVSQQAADLKVAKEDAKP